MSSLKVEAWSGVSKAAQRGRHVAIDISTIRTAVKGTNHLSSTCLDAIEAALQAEADQTKASCIADINALLTP